MKKSGIELIAQERAEQISKHGRTIEQDVAENQLSQLVDGAIGLLKTKRSQRDMPSYWSVEIWQKMINKSELERLIISGALIAAEIDRLQYESKNKK